MPTGCNTVTTGCRTTVQRCYRSSQTIPGRRLTAGHWLILYWPLAETSTVDQNQNNTSWVETTLCSPSHFSGHNNTNNRYAFVQTSSPDHWSTQPVRTAICVFALGCCLSSTCTSFHGQVATARCCICSSLPRTRL